jgi:hypothetical protein
MGESDCYIDYCSISFNSSACSSQTGVHIMDITCSLRLLLTLRWGLKIKADGPRISRGAQWDLAPKFAVTCHSMRVLPPY